MTIIFWFAPILSRFVSILSRVDDDSFSSRCITFTFSHLADAFIQSDLKLGNACMPILFRLMPGLSRLMPILSRLDACIPIHAVYFSIHSNSFSS